jgi:hypothetical protein
MGIGDSLRFWVAVSGLGGSMLKALRFTHAIRHTLEVVVS